MDDAERKRRKEIIVYSSLAFILGTIFFMLIQKGRK